MEYGHFVRKIKLKFEGLYKENFVCPACKYHGPFEDIHPPTGSRKHAKCPNCSSLERHRLQFLVMEQLLKNVNSRNLKMLHFAPENYFKSIFSARFKQYETADLYMQGVDHRVDIQHLPFQDASYDIVYASHVLEHIPDDEQALSEIRRILKPNGIGFLPVPIVSEHTIEYANPNPLEDYHMRSPGPDYFDKYKKFFTKIEIFQSEDFPSQYQLFSYEDRSQWPTKACPSRLPMKGEKHKDMVPVCYV